LWTDLSEIFGDGRGWQQLPVIQFGGICKESWILDHFEIGFNGAYGYCV